MVVVLPFCRSLSPVQLQAMIIRCDTLTDEHKAHMCIRIAEADKKLIDGGDEHLQLMDVLSYSSQTMHGQKGA